MKPFQIGMKPVFSQASALGYDPGNRIAMAVKKRYHTSEISGSIIGLRFVVL